MTNRNDGGPAFPTMDSKPGITKRDWFAQNADISGAHTILHKEMAETICGPRPDDFRGQLVWHFQVDAALRYIAADAMLEARK